MQFKYTFTAATTVKQSLNVMNYIEAFFSGYLSWKFYLKVGEYTWPETYVKLTKRTFDVVNLYLYDFMLWNLTCLM